MPVYMETAYEYLKKEGEELCGDRVEIIRTPAFVLAVLADGLGSGVKANILATMTAKIISTMMSEGGSLEEVVETIASTLPVCSTREIAYSTFSILQVFRDGRAYLAEFDNPPAVFLHKGHVEELPRTEKIIAGKAVNEVTFTLEPGDRLVVFSDGALHAGTGKLLNLGWKYEDISEYLDRSVAPGMSASAISHLLVSACDCLYQGRAGDDTTVLTFAAQKDMPCAVMIGPPTDPARDEEVVHAFLQAKGKKVICGGTTAQVVSRVTGVPLDMDVESHDPDVPPISRMKGIDLVTEGVVTLGTAIEAIRWKLSTHAVSPFESEKTADEGSQAYSDKHHDGATALARLLMNDCTEVHIFAGKASNPAYHNPDLPLELDVKLRRIEELKKLLESMGKSVIVEYY